MKRFLSVILVLFMFSSAYAVVGHSSSQIAPGNFQSGNYTFNNNLIVDGNLGVGFNSPVAPLHINSLSGPSALYTGNGSNFIVNHDGSTTLIFKNTAPWSDSQGIFTFKRSDDTSLLTILRGGNVGIGTINPDHKLELSLNSDDGISLGDRSVVGNLYIGRTGATAFGGNSGWINFGQFDTNYNFISFGTNGNTGSGEAMRIDINGNVGIGTTSPISALHVETAGAGDYLTLGNSANYKKALFLGNNAENAFIGVNTISYPGTWKKYNSSFTSTALVWDHLDSSIVIFGSDVNDTSPLQRTIAKFGSNGNVGIGTTSPSAKLNIGGISSLPGDYTKVFEVTRSDNVKLFSIEYNNTNAPYDVLLKANTKNLIFSNGGQEAETMRIDTSGYVGIGTKNPKYKLQVQPPGSGGILVNSSNGDAYLGLQGYNGVLWRFESVGSGGSPPGDLTLIDRTNNIGSMTWQDSTGYVGIGTTNPNWHLDVYGSNTRLGVRDSANTIVMGQWDGVNNRIESNGKDLFITQYDAKNIKLATSNTERMRIDSVGNVGIQKVPSYLLDVNGAARFTSAATSYGSLVYDNTAGGYYKFQNEAGTWTPLGSGTLSYTGTLWTQNGANIYYGNNVGIGTTTPSSLLHLRSTQSTLSIDSYGAASDSALVFNSAYDAGGSANTARIIADVGDGTTANLINYVLDSDLSGWDIGTVVKSSPSTDSYANVGIGTISPINRLDVRGGWIQADNTATYANKATGVKVGTSYDLNIQGYINSHADSIIFQNAYAEYNSPNTVYKWEATHPGFGSRGLKFYYGRGIVFYADNAATTAGASFTPTERMVIQNNGNVGIGAESATGKLTISPLPNPDADTIYFDDGDNAALSAHHSMMFNINADNFYSDKSRSFLFTANARGYNAANSNRTNLMIIQSGGNVGIGTISPYAILHLKNPSGTDDSFGGFRFFPTNGTSYNIISGFRGLGLRLNGGSTGSSWSKSAIDLTDSGISILTGDGITLNSKMMISNDGNVGIDTINPTNKLQIGSVGSTNYAGNHIAIGNGVDAMAIYQDSTVSTFYTTTNFAFLQSGGTGNVGIGTNDPTSKLYVAGDIYADGTISGATIVDRTPYPKDLQLAYDAVMSMQRLPYGEYDENNKESQLDHSKLHPYLVGLNHSRDLSATVSVQNEVIKDLVKKNDEQKETIELMKNEICELKPDSKLCN